MASQPFFMHLQKIPPATTVESMASVLETLWKTRKSGLSTLQKSHVRTLLNLPASTDLAPVLYCLRFIIRKVSNEKLTVEDTQKLFPVGLASDIQKTIITVLLKFQNQWENEVAGEQSLSQQTRMMLPIRGGTIPANVPSQVSNISSWPCEDDTGSHLYGANNGKISHFNLLHKTSSASLRENGSFDNMATLPRLKSMTWSLDQKNSIPGNRLSIVTLKLQDYTGYHLGEVEVKFQLSRDTLEAMLRSLTCIDDQLSDSGRLQSEPDAKRHQQ